MIQRMLAIWSLDPLTFINPTWSFGSIWKFTVHILLKPDLENLSITLLACEMSAKGDQPWDFFGRNDAKAETPVLWPLHVKSWLIGKDSDAGRAGGEGEIEDEMAGWHHWLNGRESGWTPGVGDGQGGLACCDSRGRKESDTTERLNWTECNCMVVWTFFCSALLWDWNKIDLFQSCGHCWVFQICWHIECSTFTASSFRIWNSSTGIPSPPLALFVVMLPKAHLTSHSRMSD